MSRYNSKPYYYGYHRNSCYHYRVMNVPGGSQRHTNTMNGDWNYQLPPRDYWSGHPGPQSFTNTSMALNQRDYQPVHQNNRHQRDMSYVNQGNQLPVRPQVNQLPVRPQVNQLPVRPQVNQLPVRPQVNQLPVRPQVNQSHVRLQGNQSHVMLPNSSTCDRNIQQASMVTFPPYIVPDSTKPPQGQQKQPGEMVAMKMTKLPFFEVLATPIQTLIFPKKHFKTFTLALEESLLKHFKDKSLTYPCEVHIRFCSYDDGVNGKKDYYPSNLQVQVNQQQCILPGLGTIPRGPATLIDITSKCDFLRNCNCINIKTPELLGMCVHITRRLTHEDLMQKLLTKTPIDPSTTVAKIKEKLELDSVNEGDIALTSLHIALMCPVSKARMKFPCRASTCQHIQCFDASYYLKMNEKKPKWTCPVCSNIIEYENLQIDEYFKNILEQNVSSEKISLQADGSYKPFQPKGGNESILTLDDTLDHLAPDDEEPHSAGDKKPHSAVGKKPHSAGGKEPHCINETDSEKSLHTTIDLFDDSCVSSSETELPALRGTDCASSTETQNHTGAEVIIVSEDEFHVTPRLRRLRPRRTSKLRKLLREEEKSSTPRLSYKKRMKSKTKRNPTSTCTDRPGTRMVLRSQSRELVGTEH